jgi:hypothetical protein
MTRESLAALRKEDLVRLLIAQLDTITSLMARVEALTTRVAELRQNSACRLSSSSAECDFGHLQWVATTCSTHPVDRSGSSRNFGRSSVMNAW